jgi:2-oxoglutarate ferredoxin oxidoreductase subunit alpha
LDKIPREDQAVNYGVSDFCIISWGSTKGPILDALNMLHKEGYKVGFIQIKLLQPFPVSYIQSLIGKSKTIIDIEANHSGQLASLLNEHLDKKVDYYILKYTGRPMSCTEVYESVKKIMDNKAEKRQVLTYGV